MLKNLFKLLGGFIKSLFGSKPKPKPIPKPPVDAEDRDIETTIQDAVEVPVDTITTVNEAEILSEEFAPVEDAPEPELSADAPPETPAPEEEAPSAHVPRFLWCLDNGHGKLQDGKRSPKFSMDGEEVQFLEYKFNRDIVERIMTALDKAGLQYFDIVPDFNEVGSFLRGRVERANNKTSDLPKIYVSVHANAGPGEWSSASGIETWYHENSRKGAKIAAIFQKELVNQLPGWKNRHLKTTAIRGLYVLKKTNMPAILTENGFYNNKKEVAELMKDDIRQKIADAHINAILEIEKNRL